MTQRNHVWNAIRKRLFGGKRADIHESILSEPEQSLDDEIVQDKSKIDLKEQLKLIRITDDYMSQFVFPSLPLQPSWDKGFSLKNEIFVSKGEETVYRSNLEVFFQDSSNCERKLEYLASLIRFEDEDWRVFQVKEVKSIRSN